MKIRFTFLLTLLLCYLNGFGQAPPANDDYPAAISVAVSPDYTVTSSVAGSTVAATESEQEFCANLNDYNGDVWFKFVAVKPNHIIQFSDVTLPNGNGEASLSHELFRSASGAPDERILCRDTPEDFGSFVITGLVPGETILIRSYSRSASVRAIFNVSILTQQDPPANDEPSNAVALTVNSSGDCQSKSAGNTLGATRSASVANNYGYDDIWYKFTATSAYHSIGLSNIQTVYGTTYGQWLNVYSSQSGSPGARILYNSTSSSITMADLVVGDTYFIQVNSLSNTNVAAISFDLCVSVVGPPANDDFGGATLIPVSASAYFCSDPLPLYTIGATASSQAACDPGNDDDIWVKFTATQSAHILNLTGITRNAGVWPTLGIEVFSILNNAPETRVFCGTLSTFTGDVVTSLTNLLAGSSYNVRFYTIGSQARTAFNLCMYSPIKPGNDEVANAYVLSPNSASTCNITVQGNTTGASFSDVESCASEKYGDVWYRFTAEKVSHVIRLHNLYGFSGGYYTKAGIEVFRKSDNAPGTRIFCGDFQTFNISTYDAIVTDLELGSEYYVRVYSSGVNRPAITYNICILPTNTPANDESSNAIELTLTTTEACNTTFPYTTLGATTSPEAACHVNNNDDVWFKFTATRTAHIISSWVTTANGISSSRYVEIFASSGSVPGTRIYCSPENFTETTLTGLTIGNSYFIRIYSFDTNNRINFNLCVKLLPKPVNDECANAIDISDAHQEVGNTESATQSLPAGACASGSISDVWYKLTAKQDGSIRVQASTVEFNLVLEAFTGTCETLTPIICKNDAGGTETLTISNATAGTAYYFRVYSYNAPTLRTNADAGAFAIQAYGNALPVKLAAFTAEPGEGNTALLRWSTTEESNSSHFEIEHSQDAKIWMNVGRVSSVGSSLGLIHYSFTHYTPLSGLQYYRLKSVDLDGTFSLSQIRNVTLGSSKIIGRVYPNPVSEHLYLNEAEWSSAKSLRLYNPAGQELEIKKIEALKALDIRAYPPGTYLLRIETKTGVQSSYKILIVR